MYVRFPPPNYIIFFDSPSFLRRISATKFHISHTPTTSRVKMTQHRAKIHHSGRTIRVLLVLVLLLLLVWSWPRLRSKMPVLKMLCFMYV